MTWSAAQYSKFEAERNRPILDLLAQLPSDGVGTAVDLGCGPGNSTELLSAKYPDANIRGLDSSPAMIEAARLRLPNVMFEVGDISTWNCPESFDVILANAALQWVPDHSSVFPALLQKLSETGVLAVQMPDNLDEPAHRLIRKVASEPPWVETIGHVAALQPPRHQAEWYFRELRGKTKTLDIWRTTYYHSLPGGASAIVEWFKGTGLRPYIALLNDEGRASFLAKVEEEIAKAYPLLDDGNVLLPFPRLFIVATA